MSETFADRFTAAKKGMSNYALSKLTGIGDNLLGKYENGSIPNADYAAKIAEALGVSLHWLVTGRPDPTMHHHGAGSMQSTRPDPELMGRIVDRIAKVYREEGVRLADVDLGRLAAERYVEVAELAGDPDEWPGFLEVVASRVRKAIRAAALDPENVKRGA